MHHARPLKWLDYIFAIAQICLLERGLSALFYNNVNNFAIRFKRYFKTDGRTRHRTFRVKTWAQHRLILVRFALPALTLPKIIPWFCEKRGFSG
jgi:hypothetical protein